MGHNVSYGGDEITLSQSLVRESNVTIIGNKNRQLKASNLINTCMEMKFREVGACTSDLDCDTQCLEFV